MDWSPTSEMKWLPQRSSVPGYAAVPHLNSGPAIETMLIKTENTMDCPDGGTHQVLVYISVPGIPFLTTKLVVCMAGKP